MTNQIQKHHRKVVSFDEALTETKYGWLNYFVIFVCGLILINVVLETLSISFVVPIVGCELDLSQSEKAMLTAIGFIGIICSSNFWGFMADSRGRRRVMLSTMLFGFLATLISSFALNYWMLVLMRFVNGIMISAASGTVFAYLGEFHTNAKRNFAIMASSFICAFIGFLLPGFAWMIINLDLELHIPILNLTYQPWRFYMIGCGMFGLIGGLCLILLPESPKFTLSTGNTDQTQFILRKMFAWNTGKSGAEYPDFDIKLEENGELPVTDEVNLNSFMNLLQSLWQQTTPLFRKEYIRKTILACCLQFWTYFTAHGMYVWLPEILNIVGDFLKANPDNQAFTVCEIFETGFQSRNATFVSLNTKVCSNKLDDSAFLYATILEALYIGFFIVSSALMRITGRIVVLFGVLLCCGLCGIATALVKLPILGIYFYVISLLCVLGVTIVNAVMVDLYPTHLRASAVCISLMCGRIGTVVGSNVSGLLLPKNCQGLFLISGISLILNGFLSILIPKPK